MLAIYRDEQILERSQARCAQLATGFEALARLPGVKRTRALGMVAAADLGDGGYLAKLGWAVHDEARARGAQLRPLGDTVYVVPPLNITEGALDELLSVVHASVAAALETQRVRPSP